MFTVSLHFIGFFLCVCVFHNKNTYGRKGRLWLYELGKGHFSTHRENPKTFSGTIRCWQKHHHRDYWRICEEELSSIWSYSELQFLLSQFHFGNCCETCTCQMKIFKFWRTYRDRKHLFLLLEKHRSYLVEEQTCNSKQAFFFSFDNYFWSFIPRLFWQVI